MSRVGTWKVSGGGWQIKSDRSGWQMDCQEGFGIWKVKGGGSGDGK